MFVLSEHEKQNSYPKEDTEYQKITLSFCLHKLIAEVLNHRWYVHIQDRIRVHNHHIQLLHSTDQHQPLAQHQQTSCHSSQDQHSQDGNIRIRVLHIQDRHHIRRLHTEDQHQLQPL